jgi:flagellar FliL protein
MAPIPSPGTPRAAAPPKIKPPEKAGTAVAKDKKEAKGPKAKRSKKKLILMIVPILVLLAGAGWWFFLKPSGGGAPAALPAPAPGVAVPLDSISINLSGAHFLKLTIALQPIASATEVDGSKALDAAINEFSEQSMTELATTEGRHRAKEELIARVKLAYLPEGTETEKQNAALNLKVSGGKAKTDAALTGEQAIKRAAALTVQSEVYDVYLTEFVMQ